MRNRRRLLVAVVAVLAGATAFAVPRLASAAVSEWVMVNLEFGCLDSSAFGAVECDINRGNLQVWEFEGVGAGVMLRSKANGKCIVRQGAGFTYATCDHGNVGHIWTQTLLYGDGWFTMSQGDQCMMVTSVTLLLRPCAPQFQRPPAPGAYAQTWFYLDP